MSTNFERWTSTQETSKTFRVFKYHHNQLSKFIWSQEMSKKYTFKHLNETSEAQWDDLPKKHFDSSELRESHFKDIKDWSNTFNEFENWLNLSALLSVCAYLELYINSIISLAIQSDPGLLYKTNQKIDGTYIIKYGNYPEKYINEYTIQCTVVKWSQRLANYKKIFQTVPIELIQQEGNLEKIRKLRNSVAHSFGRDDINFHDKIILNVNQSERLTRKTLFNYMEIVYKTAKAIDRQLLNEHIGEYELVYFYHTIHKNKNFVNIKEKTHFLKKSLGFTKNASNEVGLMPCMSKKFCEELIKYYENI